MKYIVDDKTFITPEEAAQYIIDNLDESYFDEMLDEVYGEIEICGYSYSASQALYNIDKVAYDCGMADYYDSLYSDLYTDLAMERDGDYYGFSVECVPDEEGEEEEEEEEEETEE